MRLAKRPTVVSTTGQSPRLGPVLFWLVAAVLVPTACVLWFMGQAMRNERLVVKQRLGELYRAHLVGQASSLEKAWSEHLTSLENDLPSASAAAIFAGCVRRNLASSVVVYSEDGDLAYPDPASSPRATKPSSAVWRAAERYEQSGQLIQAAATFADLALSLEDPGQAAMALQAQARVLLRTGQKDQALDVLEKHLLSEERFNASIDSEGRMILPNAQLLALQLLDDQRDPRFVAIAATLQEALRDYRRPLPTAQRRFLMKQLQRLSSNLDFDTLAAEELAARFPAETTSENLPRVLASSAISGLWQVASPGGRVLALYEEAELFARLRGWFTPAPPPLDVAIELLPPGATASGEGDPPELLAPLGPLLPRWRLALHLDETVLYDEVATQRILAYRTIAALGIVLICALAMWTGRSVRDQIRLTRLKNDLLSTVSHELKTPLASMRLLVDTLLDGDAFEPRQTRDYLRLIASENTRLSRLVENFLTFSRMEQGRYRLVRQLIPTRDLIDAAIAAAGDRFDSTDCQLSVTAPDSLPELDADPDAVVTVLLNLLDNAYKYSPPPRRIELRASNTEQEALLAVEDHGAGLSAREQKKIFERFYQADQRLSRQGSGCGLGLSIVHHIVAAHGGRIEVESRVGEGSTFTVHLPIPPQSQEEPEDHAG